MLIKDLNQGVDYDITMNVPLTLADFTNSFKIIMARLDAIETKLDTLSAPKRPGRKSRKSKSTL